MKDIEMVNGVYPPPPPPAGGEGVMALADFRSPFSVASAPSVARSQRLLQR